MWGLLTVALSTCSPVGAEDLQGTSAVHFFEQEIRPVLVGTCGQCHGQRVQKSGLRLDSRESMLQGGRRGPAVVPGKPNGSLLVSALRHDAELRMPPDGQLTDRQIAALVRWIDLGARWPESQDSAATESAEPAHGHWAFQPVSKQAVPRVPVHAWVRTPVDVFIASKLDRAGLDASPAADRRELIRRLSFDLRGLPPSFADVETFIQDEREDAYERLIDRLLASPNYGEQWARHWLDLARYSDTKGYVYAREERFWVHAWNYRDWVVQALNEDMSYDRFVMLQLAADQLPGADRSALAAMGFLTLGRRFLGVTHDIIDDRIDVVTRGLLGLTVSCARCHDHKYDPIPTRDYYSLYGVFKNCAEQLVGLAEPNLNNPSEVKFAEELSRRRRQRDGAMKRRRMEAATRVRNRVSDYLLAQLEMEKYPEEGFDQILLEEDIFPAFVRRWRDYLAQARQRCDPVFAAWFAFAGLEGDRFAVEAERVSRALCDAPADRVHPLVARAFAKPPTSMREVAGHYGALFDNVAPVSPATASASTATASTADANGPDTSDEALREVLYAPNGPCQVPDESIVNTELFFPTDQCVELWKLRGEIDRLLIENPRAPPHALILIDRTRTNNARVHRRGDPANLGQEVPRQWLKVLAGPRREPFRQGSGRLEMARAIASPGNPLTARVLVNRVWRHHFGQGLVSTMSDFGTRARPPSHPDLLDWLSRDFVAKDWSLKRLHRRMVLSAAYRQSSSGPADPAHRARAVMIDPENRSLWRANMRRLSFEQLRDALLFCSGNLDRRMGGKPEDIFAAPRSRRRTVYGLVDRQFLPGTMRVFDFANPDLHAPRRSETTVPQQALFLLNNSMSVDAARVLTRRVMRMTDSAPATKIRQMYRLLYQRDPTDQQLRQALALVKASRADEAADTAPSAWLYGYGQYDEKQQSVARFKTLPHFTGIAWQGGSKWPDEELGWVQLTSDGGHPGNDLSHAAIRRWTAPRDTVVRLRSILVHQAEPGDGIRGFMVSSRQGLLNSAILHQSREETGIEVLEVRAGETLDFVVDIRNELNHDEFTWEVVITEEDPHADSTPTVWNTRDDFRGPRSFALDPWQQLAQALLAANEFMFID